MPPWPRVSTHGVPTATRTNDPRRSRRSFISPWKVRIRTHRIRRPARTAISGPPSSGPSRRTGICVSSKAGHASHERHGRFFEHTPASARMTFERADGRLLVRVDDVISPSILERLAGQEGVLAPMIDDWRSMVDSVAIDTAYDGTVFDVDLIDIRERRSDLVEGNYELDALDGDRPAAVRNTDMLGEEVLVVEQRTVV